MKEKAVIFAKNICKKAINTVKSHKTVTVGISAALVVAVTLSVIFIPTSGKKSDSANLSSEKINLQSSSDIISSSEISVSSENSSSAASSVASSAVSSSSKKQTTVSANKTTSEKKNTSSKVQTSVSNSNSNYNYGTNLDIEDNVFMDALIYTGYNMKKHRADGNMWTYILAARKRGLGYLSNITFGGGSTGYETTADGKPNIKAFERGGLVCASFATYVYFNYLPNVAGIDTSALTRPNKSYNANDWYIAAKDWIKKGWSRSISFTAKDTASGISFKAAEEIPIGSIICFRDYYKKSSTNATHVVIYGGYKNGYHWVYHTGNKNGPEMCAVERMKFGPDPQWPLMVITAPSNIRMSALLEVELKDNEGKAISGVSFSLKEKKTGKVVSLGKTNAQGKIVKENLSYGSYELTHTSLSGYTALETVKSINLDTKNNSYNKIYVTDKKTPLPTSSNVVSSTVTETSVNQSVSSEETIISSSSSSEMQSILQ